MGCCEVWMDPGGMSLQLGHGIWLACCTTSCFCMTGSHLLSAKVEGDSCHLICCGHIVLLAAAYPSMHGCIGIAQPMSSMCFHGPCQLSSLPLLLLHPSPCLIHPTWTGICPRSLCHLISLSDSDNTLSVIASDHHFHFVS